MSSYPDFNGAAPPTPILVPQLPAATTLVFGGSEEGGSGAAYYGGTPVFSQPFTTDELLLLRYLLAWDGFGDFDYDTASILLDGATEDEIVAVNDSALAKVRALLATPRPFPQEVKRCS